MEEKNTNIDLKKVIGAMLFASKTPVKAADLKRILKDAANNQGESALVFKGVGDKDINQAVNALQESLEQAGIGVHIAEVAGGFKFQTDVECGPWLREMLSLGKPARLSHPALETLAIIAYRQPATKSEVESVRGVNVDAMIKNLLELQLVKITGRSELPGRPLLYGTTQKFLEHFGLASLDELPGMEQLARRQSEMNAAGNNENAANDEKAVDAENAGGDTEQEEGEPAPEEKPES